MVLLRQQKDQIETGNSGSDSTQQLSNANYGVSDSDATLLTFPGDVSTNPDLQIFQSG